MRKSDRLNEIVHYLRRMHQAVTAEVLAQQFEVSVRTLYRDIQDLQDSGVPIVGEAGVGYLIDKSYHLPPIIRKIRDQAPGITLAARVACGWGEYSLVQATFNLIRAARKAFDGVTHYFLISGDCYPTKTRAYLEQALAPTADLIDGAMGDIILANPDVIVLADVAVLSPGEEAALLDWLDGGGLLLRFAGPRLAASKVSRSAEDPL